MQLKDICELIVDCEHETAPTQDSGYPSIRTPNIGRGYFLLDGVNRVCEQTYREWTKRAVPRPGDLIMAREAPVGNVAVVPEGLQPCLGQRTLLIRPDVSKVDPNYLAFLLLGNHVQGLIHAKTNGATVPHLNMKDVRTLELPSLPPLDCQKRIAAVLTAYDELVSNNLRRIQLLEKLAQALYREWFVRFRFPENEAVSRVESALGPIPEGWTARRLGEVARINRAQINARNAPEVIHYIDISSVSPGRVDAVTTYALEDAPGRAKRIVQHGDILWSCVRPNRRSHALVLYPEPDTVASTGFSVISAVEVPYTFLYLASTTDGFVSYLANNATGAAYPAVTASTFEKATIVVPSAPLLGRFAAATVPMAELIGVLQREIANLRRTRELLLTKFNSGQLTLRAAEVQAEAPVA